MWTFKPGYLGACIVAVAILGGILIGSVANVSTHTETTTAYEYKTDITGLFDVSNEPQFINFNPASNYTGYTNTNDDPNNPSGIEYTHTNVANNYRILTSQPRTEAGPSGTVNNSTNLAQYTFKYQDVEKTSRVVLGANSPELVHTNGIRTGYLMGYKVATMYDFVRSIFGDLNQYTTITLTIPAQALTAPATRGGFGGAIYTQNDNYFTVGNDIPTGGRSFNIDPVNETYSYTIDTINGPVVRSYSLYSRYIYYGDAVQYENWIYNGQSSNYTYNTSLTIPYTSTVTRVGTYDYMIPANGTEVNTASTTATIWDNDQGTTDYTNYSVNVLFGPRFNAGTFNPLIDSPIGVNMAVNKIGGGVDNIRLTYMKVGELPTQWLIDGDIGDRTLGQFPAVLISINKSPYASGDMVKVYPVTGFTDYQNVVIADDPIATLEGHDYDLDHITFSTSSRGVGGSANIAWSVYDTVLFMETYNAVFHNPSINLADYWPDMDSYRFALNGVALYGDSVTINGVNYPVTDQTITINDRAYSLKNCYISFSKEGDASITFNDINRTVDLGPTVSKVLAFYGNWGFTMGLYEGVTSTKEVYDWNVKLLGDNLNTCVLIALGVLAVVTLACVWLKVGLKLTDKLVLGAGALILVMFLVV